MGIKINCDYCGKELIINPSRFYKAKTHCCSKTCMNALKKEERESNPDYFNCTCWICGKKFHLKDYQLNKYPTHTCSPECTLKAQQIRMTGENNHQYGLKGNKNPTWKSDERITNHGYKMIRQLNHPFKNNYGFVFEHRLIAEQYLLNEDNSIEIDGKKYLKPELEVHHIDFNKLNNNPDNLIVLTKSEHKRLHNLLNPQKKDVKTGRFISEKGA